MLRLEHYLTSEGWKEDLQQTRSDFSRLKGLAETLYWDLYYTVGYSSIGGVGNGLANVEEGKGFSDGFGEAYVHNFPLGIAVNLIYPVAFRRMQQSEQYRTHANLFTLGVNLGFLAWHYFTGTENPIGTMIPSTLVGLAMANRHVSETQRNQTGYAPSKSVPG